jgi:nucleoside 2-deoxyribosyltransferase
MKIYIAAQYARKPEIKEYAARLEAIGVKVTSTWTNEHFNPNMALSEMVESTRRNLARRDRKELEEADTLLFFGEDPNCQPPRGGRHVEFGIAVALGHRILVIEKEPENIFHHLAHIRKFDTFDDVFEYIKDAKETR